MNDASHLLKSGPQVMKLSSCSTQLSKKYSNAHKYKKYFKKSAFLAQLSLECYFSSSHVKMPTIVGILTCMSRKNFIFN